MKILRIIILLIIFFYFSRGEKYLILYSDKEKTNLQEVIEPFKLWKKQLGFEVEVISISQISNGKITPEGIRDFLKIKGAKYLLIIGSEKTIPKCVTVPIVSVPQELQGVVYQQISTDYYYADLTGNWDKDKNGYLGEYRNSKDEQEGDFEAELYVGRIPFDDVLSIKHILDRTILWEQDKREWKKKALLAAAIFEYQNTNNIPFPKVDGAYFCEVIKNQLLEEYFTFSLYEKTGINKSFYSSEISLSMANLIKEWNKGYNLVFLAGHGEKTALFRTKWMVDDGDNIPQNLELDSAFFINTYNLPNLIGIYPSIVISNACFSGSFETGSFGQEILKEQAIAFIGSSGYAYSVSSWKNKNDGGIDTIYYYLYDYLINYNYSIGEALYKAKFDYSKLNWENLYDKFLNEAEVVNQMNLLSFNLFGDPSLKLQTNEIKEDIFAPYIEVKIDPLSFEVVTSNTPTFDIYIIDFGGLNSNCFEINLDNKIIIPKTILQKDDYTLWINANIEKPLNDGLHSLIIEAQDKKNNTNSFSFPFIINTQVKLNIEEVYNYPNPFQEKTYIFYKLNKPGFLTLSIYDLSGVLIYQKKQETEKEGIIEWRGVNNSGKYVASGVYIYKLLIKDKYTTETEKIIKKLCLIR